MAKTVKAQCVNAADLITIAGLKNAEVYSVMIGLYDDPRILVEKASFARLYRKFGRPKGLDMSLLGCGSLHCTVKAKGAVWSCIVDRESVEAMRATLTHDRPRLTDGVKRLPSPVVKRGQLLLAHEEAPS